MRNRDIHDPATLVEIAYGSPHAIARREQARVLRTLFKDLLVNRRNRRNRRAPKECAA